MQILIITLIFLAALTEAAHSKITFVEGKWKNSFGDNGPSCELYRKRVANYYQRLDEVHLATKILEGKMSQEETISMIALWKRTHVPLYLNAKATYTAYLMMGGPLDQKFYDERNSVEVKSELINWVSDKFIFPESIIRVIPDPYVTEVQIDLDYSQACLRSTSLQLEITTPKKEVYKLDLVLNKYNWDGGYISTASEL